MGGDLTVYDMTKCSTEKYLYKIIDPRPVRYYAGNKNLAYCNNTIGLERGFVSTRSDKKVETEMNATKGISIAKGDGTGNNWTDMFYVDTEGNIHMKDAFIELVGTLSTILLNPDVGIKIISNDEDVFFLDPATGKLKFLGTIINSKFRNVDESMEVSFSSNEFRVLKVGSLTTIFSVSEFEGATWVSADGAANIMAITGDSVIEYGDRKFIGDNWGIFNNSATRQTAALLGSKTTTETAGATYTANEQAMLSNLKTDIQLIYNKVDGMLNKLAAYGLFEIV